MTLKNQGADLVNRLVGVLFEDSLATLGQNLEYADWGFQDHFPDSSDQQIQSWWGVGLSSLTVEGETYFSNTRYRDYPASITFQKFSSRLTWTEEDVHWLMKKSEAAQINEVTSMVTGHIAGLNYRVNEAAAKHFYLGHGTTFFTGGDSLSLYNAAHTIRAGGTSRNIFSSGDTQRPFDGTALVDALILMNRMVGQNGVQMLPVRNVKVLCSHENLPIVQKHIESKYGPNTPNLGESSSNVEALRRRGINITYQVIPYLMTAYKDYWFLVDMDRAKSHLFMCWMWKPRLASDTTVSNGTYENDASAALGPVSLGWQHTFSSMGNSASITS